MKQTYMRYGPMVLRRCQQMLQDEQAAKDIMQDVFVKVMEKGGVPAKGTSSYLYTAATNLCLNYLRDHRKYSSDETLLQQILEGGDLEKELLQKRWVQRFFKKEQEDTRLMAYLHWVDGYTLEEVALKVELSVSGVRKRLRSLKEKVETQSNVRLML